MKSNKSLKLATVAVLVISTVHITKTENASVQAEPVTPIALATLAEPIKDGLKTKIFTIVDYPQNPKLTSR
nr:hypothetical protein [uncultured Sphingobacterium sp.]